MLTQADEARTETDRAGAREKVQLAILGSYGEDGSLDAEKLDANLRGIPGADVGTQNIQEKNLDVEVDGYTFEITKEGEVKDIGTVTPQPEIEEVKAGEIVTENNKKYIDKNNKVAIIPVGFKVSEEEGEQIIDEGLVIKDLDGNEFVWIPVESADDYKRTTTYEDTNISANTENDVGYLPLTDAEIGIEGEIDDKQKRDLTFAKEKKMVTEDMIKKYKVGGFYISRYEAGDGLAKEPRASSNDSTLVSKKDAYIYDRISQIAAKEKAKSFIKDANVKSGLCTGIQWDMVMAFISNETRLDGESKKYDVETASDSRHRNSGVEQTGQNLADKVCNIYDLEGNSYEYVAEKNTYDSSLPYVRRGGTYYGSISACWNGAIHGYADKSVSFRFVLYIM